jgi:protein-S-isoprenylcysteine O-methyltransferase Ste14
MFEFWPIVLTVSGLATSGLFAHAVRHHFVSEKLPPAMKLIVALSYLAIFVYLFALWTGVAPLWQRVAGLSLQFVAAGIFNWARTTTLANRLTAAFDTDEPTFLMKVGPYRFVRHPFYCSYITFWVGSSLGCNSFFLYVLCVLLIASYVVAALLEEQKFKLSPFAVDYQIYAKKTGFFFPKIAALAGEDRPKGRSRR